MFAKTPFLPRPVLTGWTFLTLIAFSSGCAYYKPSHIRSPEKLPAELIAYYRYPASQPEITITQIEEKELYTVKRVEFPISIPDDMLDKSWDEIKLEWDKFTEGEKGKGKDLKYKVRIDFYEQKAQEKLPLIIISPILGGGNDVAEMFAAFFARHGFHAAILHREKLKINHDEDLAQIERYLRRTVMRGQQGVDWLLAQPTVDVDRVGTFGISFGGIVNTFLAAMDSRLKYHVIAMAGGNLAHVVADCPENQIKPHLEWYMNKMGMTKKELQSALHHELKTDTLTFAPAIDPSHVLMFIGIFDHVIKRELARNLWKAMGEPEAVYFPFGHYTSVFVMPYIGYKSLKFFRRNFYDKKITGNQGTFLRGTYIPEMSLREAPIGAPKQSQISLAIASQ